MLTPPKAGTELGNIWLALNSSAIVAITNVDGNIIHVNDKICEISKYQKEELVGKNFRILNSGFHTREFFENLWLTIKSGKTWTGEICNRTKYGQIYWVYTSIVPCLDATGSPYQFVVIRFEITHMKKVEEQLAYKTALLETKNRELSEFAFVAAHDIREPLRKIHTFTDLLRSRCGSNLDEKGHAYVEKISSTANRLQSMVDDLLTYSRSLEGHCHFNRCDLNVIASEVISDLEIKIEQLNAVIAVGPLPRIQADKPQMRHLFQNILSNALKFSKNDEAPRIQISATEEPDNIILRFVDNGIGFDQQYAEKIFQLFVRLNGKHDYEGTGLGLSLCKRIVDNHHGRIEAKSQVGEGTTFIVTLPKTIKKDP